MTKYTAAENTAMILLDMDGTLLTSRKTIAPQTLEALLTVQQQGIRLALCSGRPQRGLERFAAQLQMARYGGLLVCSNGAKVVRCETGEVLFSRTIPLADARAVLRHAAQFSVNAMVADERYMYVRDVYAKGRLSLFNRSILRNEARTNDFSLCELPDMERTLHFSPEKILLFGTPRYLRGHYREIYAPFENKLSAMFTAPIYYEFTAPDTDKAAAISAVLPQLGITPAQLMAFGDAENDLPMLRLAALPIAMANAADPVKQVACHITASNNQNGIAAALHRFFPQIFGPGE